VLAVVLNDIDRSATRCDPETIATADSALIVLSDLCRVAEARLAAEGWEATDGLASAAGAIV
jgi:hypothetical protein